MHLIFEVSRVPFELSGEPLVEAVGALEGFHLGRSEQCKAVRIQMHHYASEFWRLS